MLFFKEVSTLMLFQERR